MQRDRGIDVDERTRFPFKITCYLAVSLCVIDQQRNALPKKIDRNATSLIPLLVVFLFFWTRFDPFRTASACRNVLR